MSMPTTAMTFVAWDLWEMKVENLENSLPCWEQIANERPKQFTCWLMCYAFFWTTWCWCLEYWFRCGCCIRCRRRRLTRFVRWAGCTAWNRLQMVFYHLLRWYGIEHSTYVRRQTLSLLRSITGITTTTTAITTIIVIIVRTTIWWVWG